MKQHWDYLLYVLRHKFYVFQECMKYGLWWQGIVHDWSKFLPSEWIPYSEYYYGGHGEDRPPEVRAGYDSAANLHHHRQPHHWQFWVLIHNDGVLECLPIPDRYRKEMLADWRGTGKTTKGREDTRKWYLENRDKIRLHAETRAWIEQELGITGSSETEERARVNAEPVA
jgi:hypothetical protein